jgi:radical SAM protein with 4Fe4S-binding SPASM domain
LAGPSDNLRYGGGSSRPRADSSVAPAVVVWNCTRTCNLNCAHCYSQSDSRRFDGELTTSEAKALINDLAELGVAVLLFSGGEPLLRNDVFELGAYAAKAGLRPVLSTNGTFIDRLSAEKIKESGFAYVGVSIDGLERTHDRIRGAQGAFERALGGMRNCRDAGMRVGVRFTLSRRNVRDLGGVFNLARREEIPRICVYHLVYAGRAASLRGEDLSHREARHAMELICRRAEDFAAEKADVEVLTVDNPADGVYIYLRQLARDAARAAETMTLLRSNGGAASGEKIGCVDSVGGVHPDQFWLNRTLGSVRQKKFSEIWNDPADELLRSLRRRAEMVKGRCGACAYLEVCGGGLRARAEAATGDAWAADPACYLTDAEIGRVAKARC